MCVMEPASLLSALQAWAFVPELPEVETIRRGLVPRLVGRRLDGVDWRGAKLRGTSPEPLEGLEGRRVVGLARRGKFLLWSLDDGGTFLVHLGMTGKLLLADAGEPEMPHTHLVLDLDDGGQVRYSDPRRFGMLLRYGPGPVAAVAHYGVEPLSDTFDSVVLAHLLASSRAPLKSFLLDQTKIAGIGNIYACEALWRAGLSPRRIARNTPRTRIPLLAQAIRAVLEDSLAAGGTSFNDYVNSIGQPGSFLFDVAVFQREGAPCPRCAQPIRRLVQSGRSTFYCPACQR